MTAPRDLPAEPDLRRRVLEGTFRLRLRVAPEAIIVVTSHNRLVLVNSPSWSMADFNRREIVEIVVPEGFRPPGCGTGGEADLPVELIVGRPGECPASSATAGRPAGFGSSADPFHILGAGLVGASHDPILFLGSDDRILSWNHGARALYGLSAEEAVGQPITKLIPPELRATEERRRGQALAGESLSPFDTYRIRKDGTAVPVCVSISPVHDAAGTIVGTLEVGRDRGSRQEEEKKLSSQLTSLRKSNRELQDYAVTVAHDLQSPLNTAAADLKALSERCGQSADEEARSLLASASAALPRMQKLIRDLLDLARLEGPLPEPVETDCAAVIAEALANLDSAVKESGASIAVGPMPVVLADRTHLMQVFQNLISNAIKFRGSQPPDVRISAERRPGEWRFTVQDNGIGIDPAMALRIFQPLQRLQPHGAQPGSGLGLAIAQKVLARHAGRIWVESTPGKGSVFYFTLSAGEAQGAKEPE